ncbi:hypothetical protein D3C77_351790 [compost metagenome]
MLHGHVGTEPHGGQHLQPFDVAPGTALGPGDDHPALAEAAGAVGLGEAVEGHHHHIVTLGADAGVGDVVVEDLVVDLVGEDDEVVLAGDLDQLQLEFAAVDGAGRVVRVDQHQAAGARGDAGADVVQIRMPVGPFIAAVVHRMATGEGDGGGPERVVGGGHQHLVAVVEQRLHGHHDELAGAIADVDVVDVDLAHPLLLVVLHHRLAGREEPLGVAVALALGHVEDHILDDLFRRIETERGRVADVELDDAVAFVLETAGLFMHRAANVIADIVELVRLVDSEHGERDSFPWGRVGRKAFFSIKFLYPYSSQN